MPELIGFRNVDNQNAAPPVAVTPPAAEAPVVEPAAVEAPAAEAVVEPDATVVPNAEEDDDEVEAPKVEDTSDEKYFEHEGVKYIKAEDVAGIVQRRLAKVKQDKIQAAAAELSKDAVNAKSLLENDNKALKRENEVLKLSKGDETTFELLNLTGLAGDALKTYAEKLATRQPVSTNTADKEFREKITEKPSTTFNAAAVMAAAREGRK